MVSKMQAAVFKLPKSIYRQSFCALAALMWLLLGAQLNRAFAQKDMAEASAEKIGLFSRREKVFSGVCRVKCVLKEKHGNFIDASEWFLAFDRNYERVRYNRGTPYGIVQFVSDGNYNYYLRDIKDDIHKTFRDVFPGDTRDKPVDIRCIGLIDPVDLLEHKLIDDLKHDYSHYTESSYSENGDIGTLTMRLVTKDGGTITRVVSLMLSQDYFPIKNVLTQTSPDRQHEHELCSSETFAEQVSGVWVPVKYTSKSIDGRNYSAKIAWEQVNATIKDDYFRLENFTVSNDTLVYNETLKTDFAETTVRPQQPKTAVLDWKHVLFFGANLSAFIVFVAFTYRYRRS